MPCPFFEPERISLDPSHPTARVPLLDEYEGACHAGEAALPAPDALRFRCCNQGYCRGICEHFPAREVRSSLRYDVMRQTATVLDVLCIEEQSYAPLRWRPVQYFVETGQLQPEITDVCLRAQLLAFCRSYLARWPQ